MSFRLNNLTEIMAAYDAYANNTITPAQDAIVRLRCALEAVINCAKVVFYAIASGIEKAGPSNPFAKNMNLTSYRASANIAINKVKAYGEAIISPKSGLLKIKNFENAGNAAIGGAAKLFGWAASKFD